MKEAINKEWKIDIGLEIHAQVISKSKLFSGASTEFGASPNSNVSVVDVGMPGVLPVLNEFVVRQAVKTGLAFGSDINLCSVFDRKHYFYPDLPQGYQITQFYSPIVKGGVIEINNGKLIKIRSIHLEQDAGKSIHDQSSAYTYLDYNRSGVALMEIITEPDISSPEEAGDFIKKLRSILYYIGTCDGDMENGSLRCDANVSVRRIGDEKMGERCEIKNLNSIRNIMLAIEYEAERQIQIIESGGKIAQETRLFNANTLTTEFMRRKEYYYEYHYFKDPDLPVVLLNDDFVYSVKMKMTELPQEKIKRYVNDFNLNRADAELIVSEKECADYFEQAIQDANPKIVANWIVGELFAYLNKNTLSINNSPITPSALSKLIKAIQDGVISNNIAKQVFVDMCETKKDPMEIIKDKNLMQIVDTNEITQIIDGVLGENQDKVVQYQQGKKGLFGFFVGLIMQKTKGKANPVMINEILKNKIDKVD